MTGKYDIEIYNSRVHYFLTVKRNITVIQGNSATGKTELIRLISDYEANGQSSGITLRCNARCTVLNAIDWKVRLQGLSKSIVFIDETAGFIKTKEFAEQVRGCDNYFVIVTRDDLSQIPYSIEEIYGLKDASETQKYKQFGKVYNEMYKLYNLGIRTAVRPEVVITEDSGSGFEFYSLLFGKRCRSSAGKSKAVDCLMKEKGKSVLVIADGAAFGSEIGKLMRYIETGKADCVLYAPESFEYLILCSGILDVPGDILDETYNHADSTRFMSWEEFFTRYLVDISKETPFHYSKSKLSDSYKSKSTIRRIAAQIPEQIKTE